MKHYRVVASDGRVFMVSAYTPFSASHQVIRQCDGLVEILSVREVAA